MKLKVCPVCAEVMAHGHCINACVWPPAGSMGLQAAVRPVSGDAWASLDTEVLLGMEALLRDTGRKINLELERRSAVVEEDRDGHLGTLIARLLPTQRPSHATSCQQIDQAFAAISGEQLAGARGILENAGFSRTRRISQGRNMYFYKAKLPGEITPNFIQLAAEYSVATE